MPTTIRDSFPDEVALGRQCREFLRLAEMGERFGGLAELQSEAAAESVMQVIGLERGSVSDFIERG